MNWFRFQYLQDLNYRLLKLITRKSDVSLNNWERVLYSKIRRFCSLVRTKKDNLRLPLVNCSNIVLLHFFFHSFIHSFIHLFNSFSFSKIRLRTSPFRIRLWVKIRMNSDLTEVCLSRTRFENFFITTYFGRYFPIRAPIFRFDRLTSC